MTPSATNLPNRSDHKVAVVVYDGFAPFDLGVVCEVFGEDPRVAPGDPWYRLFICGDTSAPVTADTGFQILVPHGLETLAEVDTVIVTPTYRPDEVAESVFAARRQAHARGCRILSLCTGAFVLARAGLLDGRRAATHWTECDELARRFPLVSVDAEVLYVDEGDILTGAGSAASIDLLLHIVRQDYGSDVATQVPANGRPPQRDGGTPSSLSSPCPARRRQPVRRHGDLGPRASRGPVTVEDLAQRSAMSPRTFARRFQAATGTTPYQWLLGQRVHLAQRLLETSDLSVETVAERSGFCTASNLRKHFVAWSTPALRPTVAPSRTELSDDAPASQPGWPPPGGRHAASAPPRRSP